MTLRDFLHKFRIKQKDFAAAVGVSDVMLSAYATGRIIPPLPKILMIEQASSGWVTPYDWGVNIGDGVKEGEGFSAAAEMTKEKRHEIVRRCLSEIGLALNYQNERYTGNRPIRDMIECVGCKKYDRCSDGWCNHTLQSATEIIADGDAEFVFNQLELDKDEKGEIDYNPHLEREDSLMSRLVVATTLEELARFHGRRRSWA